MVAVNTKTASDVAGLVEQADRVSSARRSRSPLRAGDDAANGDGRARHGRRRRSRSLHVVNRRDVVVEDRSDTLPIGDSRTRGHRHADDECLVWFDGDIAVDGDGEGVGRALAEVSSR